MYVSVSGSSTRWLVVVLVVTLAVAGVTYYYGILAGKSNTPIAVARNPLNFIEFNVPSGCCGCCLPALFVVCFCQLRAVCQPIGPIWFDIRLSVMCNALVVVGWVPQILVLRFAITYGRYGSGWEWMSLDIFTCKPIKYAWECAFEFPKIFALWICLQRFHMQKYFRIGLQMLRIRPHCWRKFASCTCQINSLLFFECFPPPTMFDRKPHKLAIFLWSLLPPFL